MDLDLIVIMSRRYRFDARVHRLPEPGVLSWRRVLRQVLTSRPRRYDLAKRGFVVGGSNESRAWILKLAGDVQAHPFRRGDGNGDKRIDLSDAVHLLGVLFRGDDKRVNCDQAYDYNSERLDITDPVFLLSFLFRDETAPGEPFVECDVDASPSNLSCVSFAPCVGQ